MDYIAKMRINESSPSCDELETAETLHTHFASIFIAEDRTDISRKINTRGIYLYPKME